MNFFAASIARAAALCAWLLTWAVAMPAAASQAIAPNDPALAFDGILFPRVTSQLVTFQRFDEATLASPETRFERLRAAPATGAVIRFTTASQRIRIKFAAQPGENRGADFGVLRNGAFMHEEHFDKAREDLSFAIQTTDATPATYEVALPSRSSVGFEGLELDDGATLLPNPERRRKAYIAIGDSITHGTGQGSAAYKTYPFLLARAMDWELFNLAVGAGKTSPSIGAMLAGKCVGVVTILVGYNDWNTHADPATYARDYTLLLQRVRDSQPAAEIYCITATLTTNAVSRTKQPTPLETFREVVRTAVRDRVAAGDSHLHLVEGPPLMDGADLNDAVHLNDRGSRHVAEALAKVMKR